MTDPEALPLRDIHLPEDPSWWPPAPGWWLLALLLLAGVVALLLWRQYRQRLRRMAVTLAGIELLGLRAAADTRDPRLLVRDLSALMRRLAVSLYPRRDVAGLTGRAWLRFLDQALDGAPFSTGSGQVLLDAPYRPDVKPAEVQVLLELCAAWIEAAGRHAEQIGRS